MTEQAPLIIVIGLGTVGVTVTDYLVATGHVRVHAIEKNPQSAVRSRLLTWEVPLTVGDGADPDVLREAGIFEASGVLVMINGDDHALRVGLATRRLRGDRQFKVVMRLFNHHTVENLPASACLEGVSLAAVVAPTFVAAALVPALRDIFSLGTTLIGAAVLPVAITGDAAVYQDGADHTPSDIVLIVAPQDAIVFGTPTALQAMLAPPTEPQLTGLRDIISRWYKAIRTTWTHGNPLLRRLLVALVAVLAVATCFYAVLDDKLSIFQSLYFVVSTMTTVGYGDIHMGDKSAVLILFTVALMLIGSLAMAVVFAFITDLVVGEKIEHVLGVRAALLRDHIIIVGLGSVGLSCAVSLREQNVPVIVIDPDTKGRFLDDARAMGIPVLLRSAGTEGALREAGIDYARAVLCVTSNEQVNVEVGLLSRGMKPGVHVVLRVFSPSFAADVQSLLDMPSTFSAAELAAPAFAMAVLDHPLEQNRETILTSRLPIAIKVRHIADTLTFASGTVESQTPALWTAVAVMSANGGCKVKPTPFALLQNGDTLLLAEAQKEN